MGKVLACKTADVPPGGITKVTIDGRDIMIVNYDGSYIALDDTCTHAGASLSEGKLEGSHVVCDWHGAEFDCSTGKLAKFPVTIRDLQKYSVTVESESLFVEV